MTGKKVPPIWADFLKNAADKDAMKPFIAAASAFSRETGVVSGIAGAGAFLDMYGSALSDPDEGLTSSAGSKSKYCSRESVAGKDAEQMREVEELARQQVELEMDPMLSSW